MADNNGASLGEKKMNLSVEFIEEIKKRLRAYGIIMDFVSFDDREYVWADGDCIITGMTEADMFGLWVEHCDKHGEVPF